MVIASQLIARDKTKVTQGTLNEKMVTPPARGGCLALGMSAAHADDNNTLYFYNGPSTCRQDCLNSSPKKPVLSYLFDLRVERNHVREAENVQNGAYDLVVPSTYYVDKMRKEG